MTAQAAREKAKNVSAAEQLAANLNFSALGKAEELKKRIWFTLGALLVYRSALHSAARDRPNIWSRCLSRRPAAFSACSTCSRAAHSPHGDLCAEHHAVYFGLDHHPASDHGVAAARSAEEGSEAAARR